MKLSLREVRGTGFIKGGKMIVIKPMLERLHKGGIREHDILFIYYNFFNTALVYNCIKCNLKNLIGYWYYEIVHKDI